MNRVERLMYSLGSAGKPVPVPFLLLAVGGMISCPPHYSEFQVLLKVSAPWILHALRSKEESKVLSWYMCVACTPDFLAAACNRSW
jgi:hypothetical protein